MHSILAPSNNAVDSALCDSSLIAQTGFALIVDGRCKLSQHLTGTAAMNFSYKQGNLRPGLVVLLNIQAEILQGRHCMQLQGRDWHCG